MKQFIFILSFVFGLNANAQFQEILEIPDNYSAFLIKDLKFNESGKGFIIAHQSNNGTPIFGTMIYNTVDSGQTWDSSYFSNKLVLNGHGAITENGNLYFVSLMNVFPTGQPSYQLKVFNRSFDDGQTWSNVVIDSSSGPSLSYDNALHFLNDSTGVFYYSNGIFQTNNFGATWTKVFEYAPNDVLPMNNQFAYFAYDTLYIDDLTVDPFAVSQYRFYTQGRQDFSALKNNTVYRNMNNWEGQTMGPNYGQNYVSLQVDPLPFGNQKIIHFPQMGYSKDLAVPGNCVFMQGDGRIHRGCDQGDSFYTLNSFPSAPLSTGVEFIEFINDTLGFAITYDAFNNDWKLWKTTNGGGPNGAPVLTNTFYAGTNELTKNVKAEVFPNPSDGNLTVSSEIRIDQLELYSLDGRKCLEMKPEGKQVELNLSHLAKGTYLLQIKGEGSQVTKKIVIE